MSHIDPYYFVFDSVGYPDNLHPIEIPDGFVAYLLSSSSIRAHVFVYLDRQEFSLSSKQDDKDVIRLFTALARKLAGCEQVTEIFELYDNKELHKACEIKINHQSEPVYRIRKNSLRLYFVIVGSDMVLFRLSTKRQDKLSPSELNLIEKRVQAIFAHPIQQRVMK